MKHVRFIVDFGRWLLLLLLQLLLLLLRHFGVGLRRHNGRSERELRTFGRSARGGGATGVFCGRSGR
jgi:hypothetical protein